MQFSHKQKLLEGLLERRMNMREGMGMLYSFHVWLLLFRLVLDRFDQKLRMAELLSLILKPNNRMVSIVYACPLPNYKNHSTTLKSFTLFVRSNWISTD